MEAYWDKFLTLGMDAFGDFANEEQSVSAVVEYDGELSFGVIWEGSERL